MCCPSFVILGKKASGKTDQNAFRTIILVIFKIQKQSVKMTNLSILLWTSSPVDWRQAIQWFLWKWMITIFLNENQKRLCVLWQSGKKSTTATCLSHGRALLKQRLSTPRDPAGPVRSLLRFLRVRLRRVLTPLLPCHLEYASRRESKMGTLETNCIKLFSFLLDLTQSI